MHRRLHPKIGDIRALTIKLEFGGIIYYSFCFKEPLQNSIGNDLGPYITPLLPVLPTLRSHF